MYNLNFISFNRPTAPKIPDGEKVDFDVSVAYCIRVTYDLSAIHVEGLGEIKKFAQKFGTVYSAFIRCRNNPENTSLARKIYECQTVQCREALIRAQTLGSAARNKRVDNLSDRLTGIPKMPV